MPRGKALQSRRSPKVYKCFPWLGRLVIKIFWSKSLVAGGPTLPSVNVLEFPGEECEQRFSSDPQEGQIHLQRNSFVPRGRTARTSHSKILNVSYPLTPRSFDQDRCLRMSEDYQISIMDSHGRFQCFGHNIGQRMFLQLGLHPGKVHISSYSRELKSLNVIDRV